MRFLPDSRHAPPPRNYIIRQTFFRRYRGRDRAVDVTPSPPGLVVGTRFVFILRPFSPPSSRRRSPACRKNREKRGVKRRRVGTINLSNYNFLSPPHPPYDRVGRVRVGSRNRDDKFLKSLTPHRRWTNRLVTTITTVGSKNNDIKDAKGGRAQ